MPSQEIVAGSLAKLAQSGRSIAELFSTGVEAIIVIDISASMATSDARGGQTRYAAACAELRRLQSDKPGKLAIIEFSCGHAFCPGGIPSSPSGMTSMSGALEFVKKADGAGIQFILISDGEPDCEDSALRVAGLFSSKIDTIYIGPENGPGADFLRRLSALTGGISAAQNAAGIVDLSQTVSRLLSA